MPSSQPTPRRDSCRMSAVVYRTVDAADREVVAGAQLAAANACHAVLVAAGVLGFGIWVWEGADEFLILLVFTVFLAFALGVGADQPRLAVAAGRLLTALLKASPRVLSRRDLERAVWGDIAPDSDALRSHLYNLRKAIDKPFDRPLLHTVPGLGYRLASRDAE